MSNSKLDGIISRAKAAKMPKDSIEAAIKSALRVSLLFYCHEHFQRHSIFSFMHSSLRDLIVYLDANAKKKFRFQKMSYYRASASQTNRQLC